VAEAESSLVVPETNYAFGEGVNPMVSLEGNGGAGCGEGHDTQELRMARIILHENV